MVSSECLKEDSQETFSAMGQACLFMAFDLCFGYAHLWGYKQSILDLPPWHLKYFDSGITQGFKCLFQLTAHYLAILYLHIPMSIM